MSDPHHLLHTRLKDLTQRYGQRLQQYQQVMYRGDQARADEALSEMQQIEHSVIIIERPTR